MLQTLALASPSRVRLALPFLLLPCSPLPRTLLALLRPPRPPFFDPLSFCSSGLRGIGERRPATFVARFSTSPRSESDVKDQEAAESGAEFQGLDGSSTKSVLKPGLYLVATPIGNLEDITLRALRVLRSADVILAEDTRHSWKLLQYFSIKTPLLSFHKFNENQRGKMVLTRLHQGHLVALISDAGTPGISDPGTELVKSCVNENIPVIPIPGPSALLTALSASGLSTNEFTFVGFLPKHAGSRRERLMVSAKEKPTQVFFVPPHKLHQFLDEASSVFGDSRSCVIAREMTKVHEEFWRGTLGLANKIFSTHQPKGELTVLIEGDKTAAPEIPTETEVENRLKDLFSNGHTLSEAVKLVAEGSSAKRKQVYALALRIFGKHIEVENSLGDSQLKEDEAMK